jgi:hypothetical protein
MSSVPSLTFLYCLPSFVSCFTSLLLVSHPLSLSHIFVLCLVRPLSYVSAPCLWSLVPCLTYQFLAYHLLSLDLLPVPCILSSITWLIALLLVSHPLYPVTHYPFPVSRDLFPVSLPSSFLCPLTTYQLSQCPLFCGSIPLFLSFALLFPVLCSSVSCPLSLAFHTCENGSFLKNIHAYTCSCRF